MSYSSIVAMAGSQSLKARIVAAAASLGADEPLAWANANVWHVVSDSGFAAAWDYAVGLNDQNANPDTGFRSDVITDQMLTDAVTARMVELAAESV